MDIFLLPGSQRPEQWRSSRTSRQNGPARRLDRASDPIPEATGTPQTMNIHVQGAELRGRFQLRDATVDALAERYRSARRVYFSASFEQERRHRADCFMITADELLDWILDDTEILERNLHADPARTDLLQRALAVLEEERPLNGEPFSDDEVRYLRGLNLSTLKPGIVIDGPPPEEELHRHVSNLHPALGRLFFYTAGKTEARVWDVSGGAAIAEAAGQIHSDLERGFIRAEVFNVGRTRPLPHPPGGEKHGPAARGRPRLPYRRR